MNEQDPMQGPQTEEQVQPAEARDRRLGQIEQAARTADAISGQIRKAVIGQDEVIEQVMAAFLAGGHVLIEGVPGLGKTLLVRALAKTIQGEYGRIQFTPDLMPSDVIGHVIYDMDQGKFKIRRGPIFTNILLSDEINRAPAKTQAALLEAMQERQVTLEGRPMALPKPFMCLATQNPVDQEGTYPLPEAQLDRFLLKIRITYPQAEQEMDLVKMVLDGKIGNDFDLSKVNAVVKAEEVRALQRAAASLEIDDRVVEYAIKLARTTREWPGVSMGAGPRGAISLLRAARGLAMIRHRDFVIPDDIKTVALPALRHRLTLTPDLEIEGRTPDDIIHDVLTDVEAPRL